MFVGKIIYISLKILVFREKVAIKNQGTHFWAIHLWQLWQKMGSLIINIISLFLLTQIYNRIAPLPQPLPHFSSRCHKLPQYCHKHTTS